MCICRWITTITNRVELVILQHPLEVNNAKNTAGLLHLSLANSQLHIGENFAPEQLDKLLARDGKTNLLLYPPTPEAESMGIAKPPALPDLTRLEPEQLRLWVIDGTWRKSRKMLYLNTHLQQLPRVSLADCPPSAYRIRKAQGEDQLSTLEASCYALQHLEASRVDYQPLLDAFDGFIAQQMAFLPNHPNLR
jgi:DTW domain-containing protein YfiP